MTFDLKDTMLYRMGHPEVVELVEIDEASEGLVIAPELYERAGRLMHDRLCAWQGSRAHIGDEALGCVETYRLIAVTVVRAIAGDLLRDNPKGETDVASAHSERDGNT